MNLILTRKDYLESGIFGTLKNEAGELLAVTLEHSYPGTPGLPWLPKLPYGTYVCKRGQHQLHSGPIETFEITGVPGHSGILFHCGNREDASEGCVLLGLMREGDAILSSREAFRGFLAAQAGLDSFTVTVCG